MIAARRRQRWTGAPSDHTSKRPKHRICNRGLLGNGERSMGRWADAGARRSVRADKDLRASRR